jgi:hypothetical protein
MSKSIKAVLAESPDFAEFWKHYPKKRDWPKAYRAWCKLAPSEDDRAAILADIERRRESDEWRKAGGAYIPYPATYLNGRRWEDGEGIDAGAPASGRLPTMGSFDTDDFFAEALRRSYG